MTNESGGVLNAQAVKGLETASASTSSTDSLSRSISGSSLNSQADSSSCEDRPRGMKRSLSLRSQLALLAADEQAASEYAAARERAGSFSNKSRKLLRSQSPSERCHNCESSFSGRSCNESPREPSFCGGDCLWSWRLGTECGVQLSDLENLALS